MEGAPRAAVVCSHYQPLVEVSTSYEGFDAYYMAASGDPLTGGDAEGKLPRWFYEATDGERFYGREWQSYWMTTGVSMAGSNITITATASGGVKLIPYAGNIGGAGDISGAASLWQSLGGLQVAYSGSDWKTAAREMLSIARAGTRFEYVDGQLKIYANQKRVAYHDTAAGMVKTGTRPGIDAEVLWVVLQIEPGRGLLEGGSGCLECCEQIVEQLETLNTRVDNLSGYLRSALGYMNGNEQTLRQHLTELFGIPGEPPTQAEEITVDLPNDGGDKAAAIWAGVNVGTAPPDSGMEGWQTPREWRSNLGEALNGSGTAVRMTAPFGQVAAAWGGSLGIGDVEIEADLSWYEPWRVWVRLLMALPAMIAATMVIFEEFRRY